VNKSILSARLTLLHGDTRKAQEHLKSALNTLHQYTHSNLASQSEYGTGNQHIALLLPTKGPHAKAAKIVRDGFLAAYYQARQNQPSDTAVKIYDTHSPNVEEAYRKALAEKASLIVGPLTKPEVQLIAKLHLDVPVLALNTISEDNSFPRNLYQFGLMPEDEVFAVGAHALRQGRSRALILAPESEWGQRLASTFKHFWTSHNAIVVDIKFFKSPAELESKIRALLQVNGTTRRTDADMIFIAASNALALQIKPLLNMHDAETLPVYATSSIYSGTRSPNKDQDLDGIHFCDMPWVLQQSPAMQEAHSTLQKLWPNSVNESPRFFALGMDAYQLATQLEHSKGIEAKNIPGFTGELQINNYQRVQRGLACARFEHGIPVPD
jgi:outer membrane PBP1 activator LpoA protein